MDPRLWLYLDNLRCGHDPACNLTVPQRTWAERAARDAGFVSDEPKPNRLTRKGEIALRLSLSADRGGEEGEDAGAPDPLPGKP